jgi:hypothetical protein
MPELPSRLSERWEPEVGQTYTIKAAEIVRTDVQGYHGVRVVLEDKKNNSHVLMLWIRQFVGEKSKLGAFQKALGNNTDNWIGKKIKIVKWIPRQREIEVL